MNDSRIAALTPEGQSFQAIVSGVLSGKVPKKEITTESIECLRKILNKQKTLAKVKKTTFYASGASGAIGFIEPITGVISLVASLTTPLIMSYSQQRAWRAIDKNIPGIRYLYRAGKDLNSEFVMNSIVKFEDKLNG